MISSFFDQTKPINFLVLLGFVMLLFWGVTLRLSGFDQSYSHFIVRAMASIMLVFSVFLLGNMVKTKKLTLDNSFAMLFFSILLFIFFGIIKNVNAIFCCCFLLISWDRTLALKYEKNHKEKIFEASLWLAFASLFIDWALLFIIPLYIAISLFSSKQLRLWLMPFAAFFCVAILTLSVSSIFNEASFFVTHYQFLISLDFFLYPNYGTALFIVFSFVFAFLVLAKLGYRRLGRTLSLRLVFAYLVTATILVMFTNSKQSGVAIFSFFPTAVFFANYLETIKKPRFKEFLVTACIILPIINVIIRLVQ